MLGQKTITIIGRDFALDLKSELREQGHYLTGALENSIESQIVFTGDGLALEISALDYLNPVNTGVPAENIPYNSGVRSGAGTSAYIQGLVNYVKKRMGVSNDKEALGIAFAIAKKHENEGMPTAASSRFSSNGRRTGALDRVIESIDVDAQLEAGISKELDDILEIGTVTVI